MSKKGIKRTESNESSKNSINPVSENQSKSKNNNSKKCNK